MTYCSVLFRNRRYHFPNLAQSIGWITVGAEYIGDPMKLINRNHFMSAKKHKLNFNKSRTGAELSIFKHFSVVYTTMSDLQFVM